MNIFDELKQQINRAVEKNFNLTPNQKQLSVEMPKEKGHGDLSTNIAMLLAKALKQSPLDIAKIIQAELEK